MRLAGIEAGTPVLEIGPGIGSLTVALLDAGALVTALELDRHVIPALEESVDGHTVPGQSVRIVNDDALRVDLTSVMDPDGAWSVVSNLPYNVATPIVMRLLDDAPQARSMMVMVQREVGERMAAGPGTKTYGAVSVKIAYYARAEVVGLVPPSVFIPAPKVESALVRITRHAQPPVEVPSPERLFALVRAGFGQRRKMLRGALRAELGDQTADQLTAAGIDGTARAETLHLEQWAALARVVGV